MTLAPISLPDLVDHAEDVPLGRVRVRADHEIGGGQEEEVDVMVLDIEGIELELPDQPGGRRGFHVIEVVQGLGGGHVMGRRTYAADVGNDAGHLLGGPPQAEPLEAPELRYLPEGVLHIPLVVQEDLDLPVAFQTCNRIDGDGLGSHGESSMFFFALLLPRMDEAWAKRYR